MLEMIRADFLAWANLETGNSDVLMTSLDCLFDPFQSPEFLPKARVCYQIVRSALDSLMSRSAVIRDSPSTSAVAAIMRSAGSLG